MNSFKINKRKFESNKPELTGQEILTIAGLIPTSDFELLYKINEGGFEPIQLDEVINIKQVGREIFRARPYNDITIKVDNEEYKVSECFLSPNEISDIVGLDRNRFFLNEVREDGIEVTYKEDSEHKIALTKSKCFISCERQPIECIIINARTKEWNKNTISFSEIIILHYGQVSSDPNVIYTITYKGGVSQKPEGTMVKGDTIFVNNKMIINVSQTNKS